MNGEPPCNVKFCFEGEEEVGSPNLEEYVNKNPDLFKSDAVIWEYGKIDSEGRPVVGLGVKGMIYLELTVRSLSQDAHSMYAAALPSPSGGSRGCSASSRTPTRGSSSLAGMTRSRTSPKTS